MYLKMIGSDKIKISKIHQTQTYAGLLCGLPDKKMNDNRIEDALKNANISLFNSSVKNIKTTLVNPHITLNTTINSKEKIEYPILPAYTTTLLLEETIHDRHAIVVLYMKKLFSIEEVQELIINVDWKSISEEFYW